MTNLDFFLRGLILGFCLGVIFFAICASTQKR